MIRFLDADNLKIITKSDHVIYKSGDSIRRNYIVQIGKQGLVNLEDLGISDFEESFG